MPETGSAEILIEASEEKRLAEVLEAQFEGDSITAAYVLKDHCYDNWTAQPTVAQSTADTLSSLAILQPEPETVAVAFWIRGISEITKGKLDSAILNLEKAHAGFLQIGKIDEAAQTQVAALIPLGLLGEYERAESVGRDAHKVLSGLGQAVAAGKIELNLSNIAARQGKFNAARKYGESAVKTFSRAGENSWLVMAENDLANTLSELNEFESAEVLYERALATSRAENMKLTEAELLASLGNLKTYRGQYGKAIRFLEQSRIIFESLNMPHQTAVADLEIAEIYQILNLIPEAGDLYKQILGPLTEFKMRGEAARAHANLGKLALANKEFDSASEHLHTAGLLFEEEENLPGTIAVNLIRARHLNAELKFDAAVELMNSSIQKSSGGQYPRHELEARHLLGETLGLTGRNKESTELLNLNIKQALDADQFQLVIPGYVSLARNALADGKQEVGEEFLLKAVDLIDSLRAPIPAEEFRMSFLADKIVPFTMLQSEYLKQGKTAEAFVMSERARARTLLEKLESETRRASAGGSEYNNLREQLNWHYSKLQRDGAGDRKLNARISELEKLLSEQRLRDSSVVSGFSNGEKNWQGFEHELHTKLGSNRKLLSYTIVDGMVSAFLLDDSGIQHFEGLGTESALVELLEGLKFQFESVRFGSSIQKHGEQLKKRTLLYLERIYDFLIAPFDDRITGNNLVIIPSGTLFYVPFNALFDGDSHLIENHEIVLAPSAAIWSKIQTKPQPFCNGYAAAFADESIPEVEAEAELIGKMFRDSQIACGRKATLEDYFKHSKSAGFLHLACHGEFRPDNPMYSNLRFADGFLNVRDIASQQLNAQLVTLSACETGLSKIYPGEEVLGLVRGFLGAGTQNIVMSLWTVNDRASFELMKTFYHSLSEQESIAKSLQTAQIEAINNDAHPYFWAAFAMIGA